MLSRTPARRHGSPMSPCLLLVVIMLLGLAAAAPTFAKSGRVGPETMKGWEPGALATRLAQGGDVSYGIYDAQPTGAITYAQGGGTPSMTLTATDATGKTVWSTGAGDVWAASGTLPAALVATFPNGDPNVLRNGELRAYDTDGDTLFRKRFTKKFVQPLADTARRLVWLETSAKAVTRVFVRQGGFTHSVALGYVPPEAHFVNPAAASADGSRIVVGESLPSTSQRREMVYWLRVSREGVPTIVSHRITDWAYAALSPSGDRAAIMTSEAVGGVGNLWVRFGRFSGRLFEGEASGQMDASAQRIFVQGAYTFGDDQLGWSTYMVTVLDHTPMMLYKRAWTFNEASSSIWFRHDGQIKCLAGVTNSGALTVINTDTWAIASVPGTYAAAVPIDGGRLATMTKDGTLAIMDDPVEGP
jgi:hypothetical protein